MVESGTKPTSKADMIAAFPEAPPAIQGEPELKDFLIVLRQLMDCSQMHEYSPSNWNMLFICLPEAQYEQHKNEAYPAQVVDDLVDIHNYINSTDAAHRSMIWHNFCCQKKWSSNAAMMISSLIDRFLTLLQPVFTERYKLI